MSERVALVTGAHGFLGRHTARALASAGFAVRGIGHGNWSRATWQSWGLSEWYAEDVTLDTLLAHAGAPDVVVHCAGAASVPFSMTHPAEDFARTVEPTVAVLEHVRRRAPAARVVLVSTGSVYGSVAGAVDEDAPLSPQSPYASHKVAAEILCREYARFFGVASAIVRLFSIHGPGLRKQLLWDACGKFDRGEATFGGTGQEVRDWIYVDDAATLLVRAVDQAATGVPVVNGGTGVAATVADVVSEVARLRGFRGPVTFTGQQRAGDPLGFVADAARAHAWGWRPSVGWREGVSRYVEWFGAGAP